VLGDIERFYWIITCSIMNYTHTDIEVLNLMEKRL
jgi:hypothetical protein